MALSIRSSADMARVLASPIDADLKHLLQIRRDQLSQYDGYDLGELGHFHVFAGHHETVADVEAALGLPLLVDGAPWWEHAEIHHGYFELTFVVSDDGFGHVALISERTGNPELLAMLRRYV